MSQRQQALTAVTEPQVVTVDAALLLQTYDQYLVITANNVAFTLPQNPQWGETHTFVNNGAFDFTVSGGAFAPLTPSDPVTFGPGTVVTFYWGSTGWQQDQATSGSADFGAFGDGSDGAATLDGVAAPAFTGAPVGSVYTMVRDAFLTNLTVNAGITLNTGGFRLFVNGIMTIAATGIVMRDGNAGALGVAGAALAANTLGASHAGGAGGNNAVGTAGTNGTQQLPGGTGAGGAGGAGGGNAGGAAGTYTALTAAQGSVRSLPNALIGSAVSQAGVVALRGGSGGGGGGSSAATTTGGGGGGGGGVVMIAALTLVNNGRISARGGTGADASGGAGDSGGGGGGGGGDVILITRSKIGTGTVDANAGAGGALHNAGIAGAAGANGNVLQLTA